MLSNPFLSFKQSKALLNKVPSNLPQEEVHLSQHAPIQQYTLNEVSKHTSSDDLWMIIHGKVYNVTQFITDHPGGAEVLFECAGIDATLSFDDVGHSDDAIAMLEECRLGDLSTDDKEFLNNISNIKNDKNRVLSITSLPPITSSYSSSNIRKKIKTKNKQRTKLKLVKPNPINLHKMEILFEKCSIPVLICISISALLLYIYLQSVKWDY